VHVCDSVSCCVSLCAFTVVGMIMCSKVYTFVQVFVFEHVFPYLCMSMDGYLCMIVSESVSVLEYSSVYDCVSTCVGGCLYVCICFVCACMHVFLCFRICVHTKIAGVRQWDCVFVYACMCQSLNVCIFLCANICVFFYFCALGCLCVGLYVCVTECICILVSENDFVYMFMCLHVCVFVYVSMCVHLCIENCVCESVNVSECA